jgi:hypothetical protein
MGYPLFGFYAKSVVSPVIFVPYPWVGLMDRLNKKSRASGSFVQETKN